MTTQSDNRNGDGLDLAQLMDQIRNDAEKRKRESFPNGVPTLYRQLITEEREAITESIDLPGLPDQRWLPPLKIQPEFQPREEYQLSELLAYHDDAFVRNAYEAILKREADDTGLAQYLQMLRNGRHSKIDILRSLRYSPEGRRANVTIRGLGQLSFLRKIYRVPLIGYLAGVAVAFGRLPILIVNHRRLESHTMAQFDRIAAYINDAVTHVADESRAQAEANRKQLENLEQQLESLRRQMGSFQTEIQQHVFEQWDTARLQMGSLVREHSKLMDNYNGLRKSETTLRADVFAKLEEAKKREGDPVLPAELQTVKAELEKQINDLTERLQKSRMDIAQHERRLSRLHESSGSSPAVVVANPPAKREADHSLDSLFVSLEDALRGTSEQIKEEAKVYLPVLQNAGINSGVLDVGCGRGEWLQVLKEAGAQARGIDQNRILVEHCRDMSLDVVEGDALDYLGSLPDEALEAITAFHFVEHVPLEALVRFLDEAGRTLKPGGLFILETPNPENLLVGSCNFYLDPTHQNPIPVQTMTLLLEARGFRCEQVLKLHPVPNVKIEVKDQLTSHVNHYLYGPMNYALVARKPDTQ